MIKSSTYEEYKKKQRKTGGPWGVKWFIVEIDKHKEKWYLHRTVTWDNGSGHGSDLPFPTWQAAMDEAQRWFKSFGEPERLF
jgi:hypothetical protein